MNSRSAALLSALILASGFAALIYQVLWVRELGLLFGSTAQSAAITIAVFFSGLGLGGWFWGQRSASLTNPLRQFAWLELGVAITAAGYFIVLDGYFALYPSLHQTLVLIAGGDTLLKIAVATTLLLPSAFLMGGTLPVLLEHLVRIERQSLSRTGTRLYGLNTLGAALGTLAAGFFLPLVFGFKGSYLVAIMIDAAVGLTALLLARQLGALQAVQVTNTATQSPPDGGPRRRGEVPSWVWVLAGASGFLALSAEISWTRLFSQVLHNSVYTYSLVLFLFLLALSLGAALANWLVRQRRWPHARLQAVLLLAAGVGTGLSPWTFSLATDGLQMLGANLGWWPYLGAVTLLGAQVILIPGLLVGAVLPALLRPMQDAGGSAGDQVGRLLATNLFGAILGAVATGFILLPWLGVGLSLQLLAFVYLLLAAWMLSGQLAIGRSQQRLVAAGSSTVLMIGLWLTAPLQPALIAINADRGERLLERLDGAHATAAAIERNGHRLIRVNSWYVLGGTGAAVDERNQTHIAMGLHPDPRRVFYLGLGTGITAGAVTHYPVERVLVCELLPEVIALSQRWFADWTAGLFTDARIEVVAEDGRQCLARSQEQFDLIISDLFTPWEAGTGTLYTLEHYRMASQRLSTGGLYVQWLPLYQVSKHELEIIAATMQAAFPKVVLWRGDFSPVRPVVALVGMRDPAPLDPDAVIRQARHFYPADATDQRIAVNAFSYYLGNLTDSGLFSDALLNTDNNGLIEYHAPRTQRSTRHNEASWVTWHRAAQLGDRLFERLPPDDDPYLRRLTPLQRGYVEAGNAYFHYQTLRRLRDPEVAAVYWQRFAALTHRPTAGTQQENNHVSP